MTVDAARARPVEAPARFAADERWGRKAALLLRPFADVRSGPTPAERERIARALMSGDPVADALLEAISRDETSMARVKEALRVAVVASTGRLTGEGTATRVAETMAWWHAVAAPDGWRPGSPGWEMTVHVRLMHARVNRSMLAKGWDVGAKGLPINQADMAATNGLFSATFLLGTLVLGIPQSPADGRAMMHLWRWMGSVMGVDEDFLHDRPRRGLRDMYHFLRTSPPPDANSVVLADSLLQSYGQTEFPRFARLRGRLDVAKHRSTATYLNGLSGMRELGQRPALPWYPALLFPANLAVHGAAAVSPRVRTALERRGYQRIRQQIIRYSRGTVEPLA